MSKQITASDPARGRNCAPQAQDSRAGAGPDLALPMRLIVTAPDPARPLMREYRDADSGALYARELGLSVADDTSGWAMDHDRPPRVVLSTELSIAREPDEEAAAMRWLRGWSERGWGEFEDHVRVAEAKSEELGVGVLLRPDAGGMLADAVCTRSWMSKRGESGAGLLLDPLGWVVPSMMRDLDDHLLRLAELCEQLIAQGGVEAVLMRSVAETDAGLTPAALGEGTIGAARLLGPMSGVLRAAPAVAVLDEGDLGLLA